MKIKDLLSNIKVRQLKPSAFMVYCLLIEKAGDSKKINKFSARGLAKEWEEDKNLGVVSNKDTVRMIIDELESSGLVKLDKSKRELTIKPLSKYRKTVKVDTDPKTGDGFINLEEFKNIVDITKVDSYKLTEIKPGKALSIEFYDKDGNKLGKLNE